MKKKTVRLTFNEDLHLEVGFQGQWMLPAHSSTVLTGTSAAQKVNNAVLAEVWRKKRRRRDELRTWGIFELQGLIFLVALPAWKGVIS